MPYSAEINRTNPTCFVILLDQSGSMSDSFGGTDASLRKADFLADVVNRTLHDLVIRCTKPEEIRAYYHVALMGYGGSGVTTCFSGALAGKGLVPINEVGELPARVEDRAKKVPDGAGGLVEQKVKFPVWVDPVAGGGTPMCAALSGARQVIQTWLAEHPHSFPPIVLNITDGESTDGNPVAEGKALQDLKSNDGNVLLFNCHLSSQRAPKIEYPADASTLADPSAKTLFEISSPIPPEFARAASQVGLRIPEGGRGFVFNADAAALVQFFDIGTRPANLR